MSVPWSRIHQQGLPQVPAHSNTSPAPQPDPTFRDPFQTQVPRTYSQTIPAADPGSEHYTLTHGINYQRQYKPSRGVHHTPAPTGSNITHGRLGRPPLRSMTHHPHPQQNKPPRSTTNHERKYANPETHAFQPDPRSNLSKIDNHGTEIPLTKTPQRSRQVTPSHSRRESAVSMSGGTNAAHGWGLQCHYTDCTNIFESDHDWRVHKIHCRSRYWRSGFQCSFIACPVSTRSQSEAFDQRPVDATAVPTPPVTYGSLAELLEHERVHHEVLVCASCHYIFLGTEAEKVDKHRAVCTARASGRPDTIDAGPGPQPSQSSIQSSSANQQGVKFLHLWVVDTEYVLNNRHGYDKSHFVDLRYPERFAEEAPDQGTAREFSTSDIVNQTSPLMESVRTAMANQLIGTLRLHNNFLTSASDVTLVLTLREKDEVRDCLTNMARLLRIDLNTEDSFMPDTAKRGTTKFSTPEIKVSETSADNPTTISCPTQAGSIGVPETTRLEVSVHETKDINPSEDLGRPPLLIRPRILSRDNSPARQPPTHPPDPAIIIAAEPQPVDTGASSHLEANCPKSILNLVGTNTVVVTTEDGEPLQETHISGPVQYKYFVQMMNCCLEAVYQWFDRNRDALLENCECSILNTPPVGEQSHGVQSALEGNENTNQPQLTKAQRKRIKKHQAAAALNLNTPGDDRHPPVCLLHTVKGPDSLTLPRWTHYLRRQVDQGRIPESIISNKESFSGEIQPVDEVRHAVKKKKQKTDRDLLALVQQARKFCWQLKDWEKCRQLDDLYSVLEGEIKLAKDPEGWQTAGRGRKKSHVRLDPDSQVIGTGAGASGGGRGNGASGRRPGMSVRQSFTWG